MGDRGDGADIAGWVDRDNDRVNLSNTDGSALHVGRALWAQFWAFISVLKVLWLGNIGRGSTRLRERKVALEPTSSDVNWTGYRDWLAVVLAAWYSFTSTNAIGIEGRWDSPSVSNAAIRIKR